MKLTKYIAQPKKRLIVQVRLEPELHTLLKIKLKKENLTWQKAITALLKFYLEDK